jgi:transposase-like protein
MRKVHAVLDNLPHCADVTRKWCDRFCGIILVDGKYVSVKGYQTKVPVIYGIDYLSHDIPTFLLSKAENYPSCLTYFKSLRLLNYPLQALVCDDNRNIYEACKFVYPKAVVQLCHNHYKENIRRTLQTRTNPMYQPFMREVMAVLGVKRAPLDRQKRLVAMVQTYRQDERCLSVLTDIYKRRDVLFGHEQVKGVPLTTNLIESYNSHLQGRLKTIKGFESFAHAKVWLNGYFIKRRIQKFTDCRGKFKDLNGKTSLEKTKKSDMDAPSFFT